jgi:DNA-binding beta-propeller fold protein YncE
MLTVKQIPIILLVMILLVSCSDEQEPEVISNISEVSDLEVFDRHNFSDGSDIGFRFIRPFDIAGIESYRLFVIKANSEVPRASVILEQTEEYYLELQPDVRIPSRGFSFRKDGIDLEGESISEGNSYRLIVLVKPIDEAVEPVVTVSDIVALRKTNLIVPFMEEVSYLSDGEEVFAGAGGISIDEEGNLYMGDYGYATGVEEGTNIIKITPTRQVSVLLDNIPFPAGNFIEGDILYQSVNLSGQVIQYDLNTGETQIYEDNGIALETPNGVVKDRNGNLYVADCEAKWVMKISPEGSITRYLSGGPCPTGITIDDDGNLYVSSSDEDGIIRKITPDSTGVNFANVPVNPPPPGYDIPYDMWLTDIIYHRGYIYVAGTSTHKIYRIDMDGNVEDFAGTGVQGLSGGATMHAEINRPRYLAVSNDGNSLYVTGSIDMFRDHVQAYRPAMIWELQLLE